FHVTGVQTCALPIYCPLLPGPGRPPRPATAGAGRLAGPGTAGLAATGRGAQPGAGTRAVPPAIGNLAIARPRALPAGVWISGAPGPVLRIHPDPAQPPAAGRTP